MRRRIYSLAILAVAGLALWSGLQPAAAGRGDIPVRVILPVAPKDAPPPRIHLPPDERAPSKVLTPLDVSETDVDWGLKSLNVPAAWKTTDGTGVVVAVLDTGVDLDHRDLRDQVIASKDFTKSRSGVNDRVGHGTHCAGVVAAAKNGWGTVGVAPGAKLLVAKVLGDDGSGGVDQIAAGVDWAVQNNADVISMSLGGPGKDSYMPPALARAEAAGVIVVAAAGNDGPAANTVGYPGGHPQCIAIAAVDVTPAVAKFSSRGTPVYAACPGVNIKSCYPGPGDGLFAPMSGTSMATPHAAGLAALWIAANPTVPKKDRPAAFRKALQVACLDLPPVGRDTATGWGLPDAGKLVTAGQPIPIPVPIPVPVPAPGDKITIQIPAGYEGRTLRSITLEFEPVKP